MTDGDSGVLRSGQGRPSHPAVASPARVCADLVLCGLISGTALIVDSTPLQTRARTQGSVDVLIAIAGAGGGALSWVVVGVSSYATLSLAGGFPALLLVPVVGWARGTSPPVPART